MSFAATVPSLPRRPRWLLLASVLAMALAVVFAVREVSRSERTLAAEGARAVRVVMYELGPGTEFRVPLEPDTDVVRIVVHATRRGSLAREGHAVRLEVGLDGTLGSRTEELVLRAPGSTERVTPEDHELTVGDPLGVNIDVNGIGTGALTLSLAAIEGADRLLVRVYRREALHSFDALRRRATIDDAKHERFARRAGEIDWLDLEPSEQAALVGSRWRKVGALGDASLVARAVALAPPPPVRPSVDDVALGTLFLRPAESAAVVAHGPTVITARATGRASAHLVATVHGEDGSLRMVEGRGEITVATEAGRVAGVEIATDEPQAVALFASEPSRVAMPEIARYWRATPERPAVVAAGAEPIVLRVSARRPVPRSGAKEVSFAVDVNVTAGASPPAPTRRAITTKRSEVDRYEGRDPELAPSERAVFYVLVPAGGVAQLTPVDGAVDLHLAELDPRAAPQVTPPHAVSPRVHETAGSEWEGWVARRPSNAPAFPLGAEIAVRIAQRLLVVPIAPKAERPPVRFARPPGPTLRHEGALFVPASASFAFELPGDGPVTLPMRVFASRRAEVVARIDDAAPRRRANAAAFERITLPRTIAFDGAIRTAVVLGDDLEAGRHVLTFSSAPDVEVWVHLPWKERAPRAVGARWISGDFEP